MVKQYDGRDERRKPRRATVKKIDAPLSLRRPSERGSKPQPSKPPTDEALLLRWLFERIESALPKDDRRAAHNIARANVAAVLHGRAEGLPGLMTITDLADYCAKHPSDLTLEDLRQERGRRDVNDLFWQKNG
jgi:hypothetical protein